MQNTDLLYLLLPGIHTEAGAEFYDFTERCAVRADGCYALEISGDFPAALVMFEIELRPDAFDYDTLYCELSEYPSGEYVKTGPWDLSMDAPVRMQVPTLDVHWRGEHYGNLWFEMPSPEDIREQRIGGTFALLFEQSGPQTIRIVVPDYERHRLDFTMVEQIAIRLDNRDIPQITPRPEWAPDTPWLLLGDHHPADWPALRQTTAGAKFWQAMAEETRQYFASGASTVRGAMTLCNAAFMALAGDETALEQLVALLQQRRQSDDFLANTQMPIKDGRLRWSEETRWLMGHGWNDYGFAWVLLENACVYQWLKDRLPKEITGWLKQNLLRYGRELYRFGVFQRQYTGAQGIILNNHAFVPYWAVGALGAVFLREEPEAQAWLDFAFGRLREGAVQLRDAAVCPNHLIWGATFQYQLIEFMRAITGEDHRDSPYFKNIPTALWRHRYFHKAAGFPQIKRYYELLTAACYASQLDNAEAQWYYQLLRRKEQTSPDPLPASFLNILWHSDKPGVQPEEKVKNSSILFRDASYALLQTNYERPRFAVSIKGGPLGKTIAMLLESYTGCYHGDLEFHGAFDVWLNGYAVLRSLSGGYRASFRNGNFVLVDGDGYYLDGAYLLGRGDKSRVAWLRAAEVKADRAYLDIVNTRSYRADLRMDLSRRRLWFDAIQEWAVIVDDVRSRDEHDYMLCLHAAEIEMDADGMFRAYHTPDAAERASAGADAPERVGPLYVRCACDMPAAIGTAVGSMVLPYPYGVTFAKGEKVDGGSGKVDSQKHAPPNDHQIRCSVSGRVKSARFVTAFARSKIGLAWEGDEIVVGADASKPGRRISL
jgi:hypothetical protein